MTKCKIPIMLTSRCKPITKNQSVTIFFKINFDKIQVQNRRATISIWPIIIKLKMVDYEKERRPREVSCSFGVM